MDCASEADLQHVGVWPYGRDPSGAGQRRVDLIAPRRALQNTHLHSAHTHILSEAAKTSSTVGLKHVCSISNVMPATQFKMVKLA